MTNDLGAGRHGAKRLVSVLVLLIAFASLLQHSPQSGVQAQLQVNQSQSDERQRLAEFEIFKNSSLFVPPFDKQVLYLPKEQLSFVRKSAAKNIALFKQIVNEAVERRNGLFPATSLMLKYTGKLLQTFIRDRLEERKLHESIEPSPSFFTMIADLLEDVVERSAELKLEHGYSKSTFQPEAFQSRALDLFDYILKVVDNSPIGAYLKWSSMLLYGDDPQKRARVNKDLVEESADLYAQFRAAGYESTTFAARRIISLVRMFGRGQVPSSDLDVQ